MKRRNKILIVDDSASNRAFLVNMLSEEYDIVEAGSGLEAMQQLDRNESVLSLVLLDIAMPDMDGFAVLSAMGKHGHLHRVPVIVILPENASKDLDHAYELGAMESISRPFGEITVKRRVKNVITFFAKRKDLEHMVTEQLIEQEKSNRIMVEILSQIIEFRNQEGGGHALHIQAITEALLTDRYELSPSRIALITNASVLHDLGKITIPEDVLCKPGKLTPEEMMVMRTHSAAGAKMLERVSYFQTEELIRVARDICRWHHERYDGGGYPDGLARDEIPISAQVVALADAYDALTSPRVYRPPFTHETALSQIMDGACGAFHPLLLKCLLHTWPDLKRELRARATGDISQKELRDQTRTPVPGVSASGRTLALLEQERTKYQFFASMSKEIQFEYFYQSDLLTLSEWGASMLGVSEAVSHPLDSEVFQNMIYPEDFSDLQARLRMAEPDHPTVSRTYQLNIHGSRKWYKIVARPLWGVAETAEMTGIIGKVVDVHEEQQELNRLKQIARYDSLTGLYNHAYARKIIEGKLETGGKQKFALLLFDLDYFKSANDRYGHLFGDQVLETVARKVRSGIRCGDITARIGGDEFLVFMEYTDDITGLVDRVFHGVSGPYQNFKIAISMGIALSPENGVAYQELFHRADQALYAAKQNGRNHYCLYDESMKGLLSALSPVEEWRQDPALR